MTVTIRESGPEDARAIAEVHVASWRQAYRGFIPDPVLDDLSIEERESVWRQGLGDEEPGTALVAEERGRVVGFVGFGPSRSFDDPPSVGEIYALYLHPENQRRGIGRRLLEAALDVMARDGFQDATLWVLDSNSGARRFYQALGWQTDGVTRHDRVEGLMLDEVRYRRRLTTA